MTSSPLLNSFIWLVILGLIFYVCLWFLNWVGLTEPFMKVAKVILGLAALVAVINLLFTIGGHPLIVL